MAGGYCSATEKPVPLVIAEVQATTSPGESSRSTWVSGELRGRASLIWVTVKVTLPKGASVSGLPEGEVGAPAMTSAKAFW